MMFGRPAAGTLSSMTARRLLALGGYATVGLFGVIVALATAGCGSGGNGGLSPAITSPLPGLTRTTATTTSPTEAETETTLPIQTTTEAPAARPPVTVTETLPAVTQTLPSKTVTLTET